LKISKDFTQKWKEDAKYKVHADIDVAVMIDTVPDEELHLKGIARGIVNKIQRLRKASKLNIDDDVEIFYLFDPKVQENSELKKAIETQIDTMRIALKVPLLPGTELPKHYVIVGKTEYKVSEEEAAESLSIVISPSNVVFCEDSLKTKFGHLNTDKVHFTDGIKSFMLAYDSAVLK